MESPSKVQRLSRKRVGQNARKRGNLNKNMKYLVYLTTCTENNKIYIGVHKTENPDIFDGYIGCGIRLSCPISYKKSKTPFQYAVNKYGISKFKRVTLAIFDNKDDAYKLESILVNEAFVKRPDTYNVQLGGEGGSEKSRKLKIYAYDMSGNFVREFESALECAKHFNPNVKNGSTVARAARIGMSLYGHQFSFEKLPCMKEYVSTKGSHNYKRKVGKYDGETLIETFESTLAAKNAGYQNVGKALKIGRKCKGYTFKYLE